MPKRRYGGATKGGGIAAARQISRISQHQYAVISKTWRIDISFSVGWTRVYQEQ